MKLTLNNNGFKMLKKLLKIISSANDEEVQCKGKKHLKGPYQQPEGVQPDDFDPFKT